MLQVRLVERNKYRIAHIVKTVPEGALAPAEGISGAVATPVDAATVTPTSTTPTTTPTPIPTITTTPTDDSLMVCDVCGYGAVCPPIRHEGTWVGEEDAELEGTQMVLRSERAKRSPENVVGSWESAVGELLAKKTRTPSCFRRGTRGGFWRCLCCGTTVHACCLDFEGHWFWYEANGTKCKSRALLSRSDFVCLHCILADPFTNFAASPFFVSSFDTSRDRNHRRAALDGGACCVCSLATGYLTLADGDPLGATSAARWPWRAASTTARTASGAPRRARRNPSARTWSSCFPRFCRSPRSCRAACAARDRGYW